MEIFEPLAQECRDDDCLLKEEDGADVEAGYLNCPPGRYILCAKSQSPASFI
jgi:hypothetical protein